MKIPVRNLINKINTRFMIATIHDFCRIRAFNSMIELIYIMYVLYLHSTVPCDTEDTIGNRKIIV